MRTRLRYFGVLLGVAAAAVTVLAAPVAAATTGEPCSTTDSNSVCQVPGDAQINDAPSHVNFHPYGGYGLALGVIGH